MKTFSSSFQRVVLGALLAFFLVTITSCMLLFQPEFTASNPWQPVSSEYKLHGSPSPKLGLIDTSAVYVFHMGLARGNPPKDVPHYRYIRFASDGKIFESGFFPDSLDLQKALLQNPRGGYGFWTNIEPANDKGEEGTQKIKIELYHYRQKNFIFVYARVYPDSLVVYKEEARVFLGYTDQRNDVYKKRTDVFLPHPIRWPE